MGNEESKLVAEILILKRERAIIDAKLFGVNNRFNIFKSKQKE